MAPGKRWPPATLRLLRAPREVLVEVAHNGRGYETLLGYLAIEHLLMDPGRVAQSVASLGFDAGGALAALYSGYVAYALKPVLTAFAIGVAIYYQQRRAGPRIPLWAGPSLVAYVWLPHVVLVALGVLVAAAGFDHIILPQHTFAGARGWQGPAKAVLEFGPCVAFARYAWPFGARDVASPRTLPRWLAPVVALVVIIAGAAGAQRVASQWTRYRPVSPGDAIPAFTLEALAVRPTAPAPEAPPDASPAAGRFSDRDLLGRVTLIDVWATWCGPCVAAMPHLAQLHRDLAPRGLHVLSINVEPDARDHVAAFAHAQGLPFPVYIDRGGFQSRMRIGTYPTVVLTDRRAVVRHIHVGTTSIVTLRGEVEALLAEADGSSP